MEKIKKHNSFGELLRSLREETGQTLKTVAELLSMDTSLLGKIERNERQPTREQIRLFSNYFKFDENKLIIEHLSDQLAYKIIEADADIDILKVAEQKIEYLKTKK